MDPYGYETAEERKGAAAVLLDLLYPPRCPVCHGIAPRGRGICPECRKTLPYVRGTRCRKCGKPVQRGTVLCADCMEQPHYYVQGAGIFLYDDVMRETVSRFKYRGRREYGRILGRLMFEAARELLRCWDPGAVIPVPADPGRTKERGYNHALELARPIAALQGVPLEDEVLFRTRKTAAMKELGAEERRKNLLGAFRCAESVRIPETVLLVDDIYTTGSTMDACARALRKKGVSRVFFLALCIGNGRPA